MPASANFVALCQAQLNLLVDGLGAVASAVYLAEETATGQDMELTPVASYPADALETLRSQNESLFTPQLPDAVDQSLPGYGYLAESERLESEHTDGFAECDRTTEVTPQPEVGDRRSPSFTDRSGKRSSKPTASVNQSATDSVDSFVDSFTDSFNAANEATVEATFEAASCPLPLINQVVIPLIHEDLVMGILVAARPEQSWSASEKKQLNHIADTLAIACVMDRQEHWMQDYTQVQYQREIQQHEVAHDFLHQFRNPLTAIRTFGKLLLRRIQTDDANHSVAEGIVRESDHLKDLFEEFRQVVDQEHEDWLKQNLPRPSQTSALPAADSAEFLPPESHAIAADDGRGEHYSPAALPHLLPPSPSRLHPSLCSLMEVIDPLLVTGSAIAQDRQLDFWTELPNADPAVWADAKALREILGNILDNALKYATPNAAILIQIPPRAAIPSIATPEGEKQIADQLQQQQQAILIADTGPGIPGSDLAHVFERHYRGVQTQTDIPGTGLGLAIAQELIEQMRGDIQVYSPLSACPLQSQRFRELRTSTTPAQPGTVFVIWLSTAEPPTID